MLYDGDRFFYGIDDLIEHYEYNDFPIPEYVYGTQIDKEAYTEFENFAKQWNQKHRISCFNVDYGTVVLIPTEEREGVQYD